MGLPYSPLCDRKATLISESQIGFIDFIVEPSMMICGEMLTKMIEPLVQIPPSNGEFNDIANGAISPLKSHGNSDGGVG